MGKSILDNYYEQRDDLIKSMSLQKKIDAIMESNFADEFKKTVDETLYNSNKTNTELEDWYC